MNKPGLSQVARSGPGIITVQWSDLDPTLIQIADAKINGAQLKNLAAVGQTLVPAPGPGRQIEFVSGIWFFSPGIHVNTVTDPNNDTLLTSYGDANGRGVHDQVFNSQLHLDSNTLLPVRYLINPLQINDSDRRAYQADVDNQALVLFNRGANYGGDAENRAILRCRTYYRVHDHAWTDPD